jgi:hypothetical protein
MDFAAGFLLFILLLRNGACIKLCEELSYVSATMLRTCRAATEKVWEEITRKTSKNNL